MQNNLKHPHFSPPVCSVWDKGYRFGFNSMEKDNEINVNGGSYDFGARIYDSRLGRWLSLDPLFIKQPGWSPFKAFLDNPIIYVDPDGETEYLTIITLDKKTGETKIEQKTSNHVMTDGVKHTVPGWNPFGGPTATWSYENKYYDYKTVILRTVGADGKILETTTSQIMFDKFKKSSAIWVSGAKSGETIIDSWMDYFKDKTDIGGGIIIYGSASSGKDSPGTKTKGKILGSFDFAAFSEIMGLVTTAIASKSENSLGPDFSGTKAADLANKTKEVVEYDKSQKEASQSTSGKTFICPTCNSTFSASDTAKHNKDLNRKSGPFTPTKNKQ
jgi:RHS repeat-associated protein